MVVYKGRLLFKLLFKLKIEASPLNAGHHMAFKHHISFATNLAVTRLFYSNLSRLPFLGQVINLDLVWCFAKYLFRTCGFVPMSYFYSETKEWSKDWAKQWALLWLAFLGIQSWFHNIPHSTELMAIFIIKNSYMIS